MKIQGLIALAWSGYQNIVRNLTRYLLLRLRVCLLSMRQRGHSASRPRQSSQKMLLHQSPISVSPSSSGSKCYIRRRDILFSRQRGEGHKISVRPFCLVDSVLLRLLGRRLVGSSYRSIALGRRLRSAGRRHVILCAKDVGMGVLRGVPLSRMYVCVQSVNICQCGQLFGETQASPHAQSSAYAQQ